jgi:choline dehydrogenase
MDCDGPDFNTFNPYNDKGFIYPDNWGPFSGSKALWQRSHTGSNYLYPAIKRPNLTVVSEALVTKILFNEQNEAEGIELIAGWNIYGSGRNLNTEAAGLGGTPQDAQYAAEKAKKKPYYFKAKNEIILCSGTFNSPQLLLLSGIGPKEELEKFNIKVISNLPGVGKIVKDHSEFFITWQTNQLIDTSIYSKNRQSVTMPVLRFKVKNEESNLSSLFTMGMVSVGSRAAFHDTYGKGMRYKRHPLHIFIAPREEWYEPLLNPTNNVAALLIFQSNIKSEGYLKLQSLDPILPPYIVMNYIYDPDDLKTWINALKNVIIPYVETFKNPQTFLKISMMVKQQLLLWVEMAFSTSGYIRKK